MFTTIYNTAIAAAFLLLILTQCSSNLTGDLNIEYEGDRITVNGYLSPDSIRLTVGKTVNFYNRSYSPEELIAPNAQVFLLNSTGEVLYELNSPDRVTFSIPNPHLIVGKNYFVKVTATGLTDIKSTPILIPEFVPLDSIAQTLSEPLGPNSNEVALYFSDVPGENYYFTSLGVTKNNLRLNAIAGIIDDQLNQKCYAIGAFPDECFQSSPATLRYGVQKNYQFNILYEQADSLILRFGAVSKELLELEKNRPSDNEFIEGINEPPLTYSNITNGYGVVFAQNWLEYKVPLK